MILYLLKSMLCALFFIILYVCLMEKESMHRFKRYFLLGSLVFSMLIPCVSLSIESDYFQMIEKIENKHFQEQNGADLLVSSPGMAESIEAATTPKHIRQAEAESILPWKNILFLLYGCTTLALLGRFLWNLYRVIRLTKGASAEYYERAKLLVIDRLNTSFSFFNYIFIDKNDYLSKEVRRDILFHELIHVKQRHSADVLFVELLIVFFWFNPALYLYRRAMKLNHEFLADEGVINNTGDVCSYQKLLIAKAVSPCSFSLMSNFTYLITKKRLIMMTKTTSKRIFLLKLIVLLPAFLFAGGLFSDKMTAHVSSDVLMSAGLQGTGKTAIDSIIVLESGVSEAEMDEYAKIVSKYLDKVDGDKILWRSHDLTEDEEKKMYAMFIRMTKEQRRQHLIKFASALNPIKLRCPNKDEWRGCINPKNQEIWLDGKLIDAKTASTYNRNDFVYFLRRVDLNKSYLWTKKGYEEYINQYGKQISLNDLYSIMPHRLYQTGFNYTAKIEEGRIIRMKDSEPKKL